MDLLLDPWSEVAFWGLAAALLAYTLLTPTALLLGLAVVIALRALLLLGRTEQGDLFDRRIEIGFLVLAAAVLGSSLLNRTSLSLALALVIALRALLVLERIERSLRRQ